MPLREDAAAIAGELADLRHAIHREPEIGLDLPLTQEKVLAALDSLPLEVSTGRRLSSVTAVLRGLAGPAEGAGGEPGRHPAVGAAARGHGRAAGDGTDRPAVRLAFRGRHARLRPRPAHRDAGRGGPAAVRPAGRAGGRCDLHVPARRGGPQRRGQDDRRGRTGRGRGAASGGRVRPARVVDAASLRRLHHQAGADAGRRRHHPGDRTGPRRPRVAAAPGGRPGHRRPARW